MSFFFPVSTSSEKHKGYCFFFTIEQLLNSLKKAIAFFFFLNTSSYPSIWLCVYNSLFHLYKVVAAAQVSLQATS